ncbi:AAA family ATPase [Catellatospora sp. KI3]|uniref:AAA family ATPase n=1 Tax=Catellatospora sp. KI3 TaxID=3041620 RepID=UPI002482A792|nr:AAA family ATPase [Catellatospora sp. KI3]MDI1459868.1 AAA family ATPase [Catellatospora sp. KI3]
MHISRVEVSDIRGFSGERAVDLTFAARGDGSRAGWTVIAGRNGSGKTSLLRAMALALTGPSTARTLVPDFRHWISRGRDIGWVDLDLAVPTSSGTAAENGNGAPAGSDSKIAVGLGWRRLGEEGAERQPALMHAVTGMRADIWEDEQGVPFCAAYGPFRRLTGGATDAQRLTASPGAARAATLFHEDASLAEGVTWLVEQHLRSLEHRPGAAELKDLVLAVLGDGLLPDGYRIHHVDSEGLWVSHGGHPYPLREMSDGYRTVAALTVDIIRQIHMAFGGVPSALEQGRTVVTAPGVVIIDEVDAHLHVSWQQRIGVWLKQHFPGIQFIVTSHSPYICQAADPGGLIRLPGPDEQEPPRVVDQDLYERIVYGTGDDAVMSELFGLDQPYSEKAARMRRELADLEIRVLAGDASQDEIARYTRLQEQLTSSPASAARDAARRFSKNRV